MLGNKKGMNGSYVAIGLVIGLVVGIGLMWWLLSSGTIDASLIVGTATEVATK